jgi:PAS domain S-box-containing protein
MDATLSFLLDKSNDFFCVMDRKGIIKRTNASFRKAIGYSEAEITDKPISVISHSADIRRHDELLKTLLNKKEAAGYESRLKAIDGVYYNIKWSLVYDAQTDLVYASGVNLTNKLNGHDKSLTDNIQHIIQSFNEGFFIIDNNWQVTTFNPAFQAITGLKNKQLKNVKLKDLRSLGLTKEVLRRFDNAFSSNSSNQFQYYNSYAKRWLRLNIYPYKNEMMIFIRDVTSTKIQQLILALEKNVLEINASALYSFPQTINELLKGIEEIFPEMICSVLELDETDETLHHIAAPRLHKDFCDAIDGTHIGPKAGSCGTAAYHRTQVIVNDIETSPIWEDFRDIARIHGLKACWSTPIISAHSSKVLATFAVYYTSSREPKPDELQMIERTSNILRILMENKRNQDHIIDQNKRLQEIATISSHEIRRPVATILGLVNLFDHEYISNSMNKEILAHLDSTAKELDSVIHTIVEKTIFLNSGT